MFNRLTTFLFWYRCTHVRLAVSLSHLPSACAVLRLVLVLTIISTLPGWACAEIIIDDFDDDLRIDVPQQNTEWFTTDSVGELHAQRVARIIALQQDPSGFLDVNGERASALSVAVPFTEYDSSNSTGGPAFNLIYNLDPTGFDFTEGGRNDAIVLDIDYLQAAVPPYRLLVGVRSGDGSNRFASTIVSVPRSDEPLTLVFPFDSFRVDRGAASSIVDFQSIGEVSVLFQTAFTRQRIPEDIGLSLVLSDIRVGTTIPEPRSLACLLLLLFSALFFRFKGASPCSESRQP